MKKIIVLLIIVSTVAVAKAQTPCSGTPLGGTAYITPTIGGATTFFSLSDVGLSSDTTGLTYQWQSSPSGSVWTNISGATNSSYSFYGIDTTGASSGSLSYCYQCIVTCAFSGISATSATTCATYGASIDSPITFSSDSFKVYLYDQCHGAFFEAFTTNYSAGQHIKTYFGDGKYLDTSTISSGTLGFSIFDEAFNSSGAYTVKHVLYDGATPVDSLIYTYNYRLCNTILLHYYYDRVGDCTYNASSDVLITSPILTEIDSNGVPVDTQSSAGGLYYTAYGNAGDIYTFKAIGYPSSLIPSCPVSGIVSDTIQSSVFSTFMKYTGMDCSSSSAYNLILGSFVPTHSQDEQWGWIYAFNNSCDPVNATLEMNFSPRMPSYSMVSTPFTASGNTITWNLIGIEFENPASLFFKLNSDSLLSVGDTIQNHLKITPLDSDTLNNYMVIIDTIQAGVDPNEMIVTPTGCLLTTAGTTQLQYTLSFMNTGNDTAYNIYALDTLSNNVDISSMRMVMTTATMNITKLKDGAGQNILKFDFPNINLLDSMHSLAKCAATTIFTINTKPGLADGTTIDNRAGVYFDYNPVVMTNTVENVVGCPLAINRTPLPAPTLSLFPNPATTELTIKTTGNAYSTYTITNLVGQQMMAGALIANDTKVNIAALPAGVYFVMFSGENGDVVKKFVKM